MKTKHQARRKGAAKTATAQAPDKPGFQAHKKTDLIDELLAGPEGRNKYALAEYVLTRTDDEYRDKIIAHSNKPHFLKLLVVFLATCERRVAANFVGLLYQQEAAPEMGPIDCQEWWIESRMIHLVTNKIRAEELAR